MKPNRKPWNMVTSSNLGLKFNFLNLNVAIFVAVIFVIIALYHFNESRVRELLFEGSNVVNDSAASSDRSNGPLVPLSRCNLFEGRWVRDNESYPLYRGKQCSLMNDELACEKYGRTNLDYQHWRWQPHQCDLPRFDASKMLEKMRNKRIVYVGDSVNRNQYMSMVCLMESSLMDRPKQLRYNGSLITFKAFDYNVTIDFYWEPLLLESNGDDPIIHRVPVRIIRNHGIEKHARNWNDADVLVFNSYVWWRQLKIKILKGSFENADTDNVYEDIEMLPAYEMALQTWFDWIDNHVNRTKTRVFFVSSSPTHNR
ncbi:OLC1v1011165C1 [Oldenlandia corymbosa var. corymbosa]|uniref:OLC1v1011165C1 n=1 Tax=Oldenlandia corymbosa var. corymbosa TaxID=529605 RepID=A0AAV1DUR3_OLDCO|nr:OLC1v1011165C1 [Oldenlandia corymbosa var. corymbosa]